METLQGLHGECDDLQSGTYTLLQYTPVESIAYYYRIVNEKNVFHGGLGLKTATKWYNLPAVTNKTWELSDKATTFNNDFRIIANGTIATNGNLAELKRMKGRDYLVRVWVGNRVFLLADAAFPAKFSFDPIKSQSGRLSMNVKFSTDTPNMLCELIV